ncbi:signal peptidase II [Alkalihalobacillus sp. AL-G]|uniref:signal peptidase II n=1 Tax=Alkalihalobacillus sp. AL-G TaxID=2926399 RepID=UPI00272D14DE|nr:signal peptidase II [Alkalihalobacillus sp. AL-G]WLD95086.1 signal peptidase II [Alkalihalobacillus sp. AL-G]
MRYYIIALIVVIIDQITKWFIVSKMNITESITVVSDFFYITSHRNRGAAFGILQGQMWLFFIVTIIVLIAVVYYMQTEAKGKPFLSSSLGLILGGAIGNFIDRMLRGEVVDFLNFYFGAYNFPIFNIADSALVVGVSMIAIALMMESKESKEISDESDSNESSRQV